MSSASKLDGRENGADVNASSIHEIMKYIRLGDGPEKFYEVEKNLRVREERMKLEAEMLEKENLLLREKVEFLSFKKSDLEVELMKMKDCVEITSMVSGLKSCGVEDRERSAEEIYEALMSNLLETKGEDSSEVVGYLKRKIKDLEMENEELKRKEKLEWENEKLLRQKEQDVMELRRKIKDMEFKIESLKREVDDRMSTCTKLEREKDMLERKGEAVQRNFEELAAKNEKLEREKDMLKRKGEVVQRNFEELVAENEKLERKIRGWKSGYEKLNERVTILEKDVMVLQNYDECVVGVEDRVEGHCADKEFTNRSENGGVCHAENGVGSGEVQSTKNGRKDGVHCAELPAGNSSPVSGNVIDLIDSDDDSVLVRCSSKNKQNASDKKLSTSLMRELKRKSDGFIDSTENGNNDGNCGGFHGSSSRMMDKRRSNQGRDEKFKGSPSSISSWSPMSSPTLQR